MENTVPGNVDVESIRIAAPAAKLLNLVVRIAHSRCRGCCATTEAVPRELGTVETDGHNQKLKTSQKLCARECHAAFAGKQRRIGRLRVDGK